MINNEKSISSISHKLSKYVARLAKSAPEKRAIYNEKVQFYINELDAHGINYQAGGNPTEKLNAQYQQINELINEIKGKRDSAGDTGALANHINELREKLGEMGELAGKYKTVSEEYTRYVANSSIKAAQSERQLRKLSADYPDAANHGNIGDDVRQTIDRATEQLAVDKQVDKIVTETIVDGLRDEINRLVGAASDEKTQEIKDLFADLSLALETIGGNDAAERKNAVKRAVRDELLAAFEGVDNNNPEKRAVVETVVVA